LVEKVRIGVIGCGVAATRDVLPNLVQPEMGRRGIELIAVCDAVESRAEATMKAFGAREMYVDYTEMLEKSDVNTVAIFTPINLHFPIAMASATSGKHVYVQKAMTTTLEEANELLSTVKKHDVKLVASPGQMHNPSFSMTKKMLDGGLIGKPLWGHILANNNGHINERTDPSWYYKPGGGPLYSLLVYSVTTFCWMLGSVKKVTALSGISIPTRWWKQKRIDNEMDDSTMILLDFGESTYVSAISNFLTKDVVSDGAIYGAKGVIRLPLAAYRSTQQGSNQVVLYNIISKVKKYINPLKPRPKDWVDWTPPLFPTPYRLAAPWGAHIIADMLELADCIIRDKDPIVASGEHARHVIEVFEKSYTSAKNGSAQKLETTFA